MTTDLREKLIDHLDLAFAELVDTHGAMVMTLATRLTDATTGQDITQEAFLRAYRALRGYTDERIRALHLRPWLATITRNLVRNEYRRRDRKGTLPLNDDHEAHATSDDLDGLGSHDEMNALLATLTETQREAVVLRHVVGLPLSEVALTMACPVGTVKSHVSRGLRHLRSVLTEPAGPTPSTDIQGDGR